MRTYQIVPSLALLCALGVGLTACGGSGTSSSQPTTPPTPPTSTSSPATSGANTEQITKNWELFFNAKTATAKRLSLLQNGAHFAAVIRAQTGQGLAALATAKVLSVKQVSNTQAQVKYDILISGIPQLKNQIGYAVLENGTWKVGDSAFCSLLTMENNGKPPSVCSGVS